MNDSTKELLSVIERCVTEGGSSIKTALESAYQLGKFDGGMEIANAGAKDVESALRSA